ncbi:MAG: ECF transporter S component [Clostridia bacterium]|nr:ECF transporter S component [Clostridia bacterium]
MRKYFTARNITFFAILAALVVVLQVWGGSIHIGATSLSFVLVPIVLGGMILGPGAGALLGFVFGIIVLIYGITGADPFTFVLFSDKPVWTIVLCLVKGTAAGAVSGLLYKVIAKRNKYAASFVAAASAPIVNTGLFILGALCMSGTIAANFVADGETVIYFLVIGCAGINFIIELAINLVLAPALHSVVGIVERRILSKYKKKAKKPAQASGQEPAAGADSTPAASSGPAAAASGTGAGIENKAAVETTSGRES